MEKPQEMIVSRQNPLLVLAGKLTDRKHREAEGLFRFDGKKLLLEALDAALPIVAVLFRESSVGQILAAAGARVLPSNARAVVLPDGLFDRISEERSPEGVICLCKRLDKIHKIVTIDKRNDGDLFARGERVLFLESIRDPGNLGTVVRTACALGVDTVVLSSDCADIYHPRVLRAAMGTLFHQRILITDDLPAAIGEFCKQGSVYAATLDARAKRLGTFTPGAAAAALVGNEGHGLSEGAISAASDSVYIPMENGVESLNAGVAAAVLLWEFYHSR